MTYDDLITDDWDDEWEVKEESVLGEFGCCMPDRCLMIGLHYVSECHDAEMWQAYEQALMKSDRPSLP